MSAQKFGHSQGNGTVGKTKMACGFTLTIGKDFKEFLCKRLDVEPDHFDFLNSINVAVFFSKEHKAGPAAVTWNGKPKMPHHCKSSVEVYQWWLKKNRAYSKNGEFDIALLRLFVSKKRDLIVGKFDCGDRNHCYGFLLNEKGKSTTFIKQQLDLSHLDALGLEEISMDSNYVMQGVPYSV